MPASLTKEDNGVRYGGDFGCDLVEMELHGFAPRAFSRRPLSAALLGARQANRLLPPIGPQRASTLLRAYFARWGDAGQPLDNGRKGIVRDSMDIRDCHHSKFR